MFDVLIAGGDVHDGTGGEPVPADAGVLGDRVAVVGPNLALEAGAVIDAAGRAVRPGCGRIPPSVGSAVCPRRCLR
jgi:N-acyl-D-amino-acid deacylase